MLGTAYTLSKKTALPFEDAVERVREELMKEGFGVLCEIDVQATLEEKLDVEREPYTILGACNPPLAHRALEARAELGTLLPCNVVVYRDGDETHIARSTPSGCSPSSATTSSPRWRSGVSDRLERRSPSRGRTWRWVLPAAAATSACAAEGVPLPLSVEHVGGRRVAVQVAASQRSRSCRRPSFAAPTPRRGAPRTSSSLRLRRASPSPSRDLLPARGSPTRG